MLTIRRFIILLYLPLESGQHKLVVFFARIRNRRRRCSWASNKWRGTGAAWVLAVGLCIKAPALTPTLLSFGQGLNVGLAFILRLASSKLQTPNINKPVSLAASEQSRIFANPYLSSD